MGKKSIVIPTMEHSLEKSNFRGGLGVLMNCLFHQARDEDYPLVFVSFQYPMEIVQRKTDEQDVVTEVLISKPDKLIDTGIEIEIPSAWYSSRLRVLEYPSRGRTKAYFFDLNLEDNEPWLKNLFVYGEKDLGQTLFTRYLLSEGTIRLVNELGLEVGKIHLQESDTALIVRPASKLPEKPTFMLTIHTPLPHGHKVFPLHLIESLYGEIPIEFLPGVDGNCLHLTKLASYYSKYIFTVSKKQEDIEKIRLAQYESKIFPISNAVHVRWINSHLKELYDKELPGWRSNIFQLKKVTNISDEKLEKALDEARRDLEENFDKWKDDNDVISNFSNLPSQSKFYVFAKRITEYKRPIEVLETIKRLNTSTSVYIFSGPLIEEYGKRFLQLFRNSLKENVKIAYILNYNEDKAFYLSSGADFWINVPIVWAEASGTSHMKAAVNGRIVISTSAGTVPEYLVDNYNAFIVRGDLADFHSKLIFTQNMSKEKYVEMSKNAISSSTYILMERMFNQLKEKYEE